MKQTEERTLSQMERAIGRVPTHEEALKSPAYEFGYRLHCVVLSFWNQSEFIRRINTNPLTGEVRDPLLHPAPYGRNSSNGDGTWDFSWKAPEDFLFNEPTDRASMHYTVHPDGRVVCLEYPNDELNISTVLGMLNLAVVIVSDCLEISIGLLDAQATAERVAKKLWGVTL